MNQPKSQPSGKLAIRTLAMPADTNQYGDIFGGWVLSQMDVAGGVTARWRAQGRIATVGVEAMTFMKPVQVGDVVCCYADIVREGTTSIAILVEVWALRGGDRYREQVTEGVFTFVAIDEEGNKRPLPPMPEDVVNSAEMMTA